MIYRFAVILRGLDVIDDDLAEAFYEAGCVVECVKIAHNSPLLSS